MYLTDIGLRMKSRPYYGGGARDVVFRNNAMKDLAKEPFIFTIKYSADVNDTTPAAEPAQFRDITVENVTVDGTAAKNSILVDGMTADEMAAAYGITFPAMRIIRICRSVTSSSVIQRRQIFPSCVTVSSIM